ncbi:hypothetical protein pEaSNUABM29_00247 [Erwinia phage pEa_SNUABM_29]|nr:hypothetical protein pEaSNUABM29_00247 [Erwinia phage pEa_SNUABM_29]
MSMNEITLLRFIGDMANCQNGNREDTPLRINLMEEEVEGFLGYERLVAFFKRAMPRAWAQLDAWFALPQAERNLNNTIFKATTALDLAGTVEQPKRLVFFYIDGDNIVADTVNWIGERVVVCATKVGTTANAWKVGSHQAQPYEEIKTNYLVPIYFDSVAPGRSVTLTKFLLNETMKVVDSAAGKAWIEQTQAKTDEFWKSIGHQKYLPQ